MASRDFITSNDELDSDVSLSDSDSDVSLSDSDSDGLDSDVSLSDGDSDGLDSDVSLSDGDSDGLDSDVSLSDSDSHSAPSSESDSGDEIAPSPRKKSKVKSLKKAKEGPKTSRRLFAVDADSEDDIPLAQIRDVIRAKEFEEAEDELIRCLDAPMWANIPFEKPNAHLVAPRRLWMK